MRRLFFALRLLSLLVGSLTAVSWALPLVQAQTETPTPTPIGVQSPTPPVATPPRPPASPAIPLIHTVQEGENPSYIAGLYNISVDDLLRVNNLTTTAVLFVGQTLTIPGGQGEAVAALYTVQVGDTLRSIAANFNITLDNILQNNRMIAPYQPLTVGQTLSVVSHTGSTTPQIITGQPHVVQPGESLLMVAAQYALPPALVAAANDLPFPAYVYTGQRLRLPVGDAVYRDLPGEWVDIQIRPFPLIQGQTLSIYVQNLLAGLPQGNMAGQPLHFAPYENGFVSLVGFDAFTPPGTYTLQLSGAGTRPWSPFQTDLPLFSANFGTQYITVPEDKAPLLAPDIRQSEDAFLATIFRQSADTPAWSGLFQTPITTSLVTAPYGDSRSYNGGPIEIFHTGIDYSGALGSPVYTAAAGTVVYSGALQLRGNAVIIDHGLGVMTAYYHLSESLVTVGEPVSAGQLIATVGSTGLSSGPHLHWDLRVHGTAVNGQQWLNTTFP